jgi:hypothetical protein
MHCKLTLKMRISVINELKEKLLTCNM